MLESACRRALGWVVLGAALSACGTWVPAHSAREVEGRKVKVQAHGKEVVIDEAITCDDEGYVVAAQMSDCDDPNRAFDTRVYPIVARAENAKADQVGYVVAAVLAAIFVPAGIIGSAVLGIH